MKNALVLALSSLGAFALMLLLLNATEAGSLVLFPVGALLALTAFAVGLHGMVKGRARLANATAIVVALILIGLATLAFIWMLWFLGVFGNGWG